ncbi:Hypothetical protein FKW44_003762 [Caligus rogercresseyi]|uniref:Uncharacterized protein n=1 Tax=Caligus rogercresseyi TaxID=217165 RepID=A0A7T8KM28_CALRO|nr:Hypothetical protein FKW44_003762 [Caligus rogercresseyi]
MIKSFKDKGIFKHTDAFVQEVYCKGRHWELNVLKEETGVLGEIPLSGLNGFEPHERSLCRTVFVFFFLLHGHYILLVLRCFLVPPLDTSELAVGAQVVGVNGSG